MSEIVKHITKCFSYMSIIIELPKGKGLSGYDILLHVRKFGFEVSAGTVYHQLRLLEKAGLIKGEPPTKSPPKTIYKMTDKGSEVFSDFRQKWVQPLTYVYNNIIGKE
ncbi:MAG: PadR family transcriptional regulator [Candidatus Bathyarchaeota archaeon]|jgi:DNA-binding PadR family transcriptional regulator